MSVEHTVKLLKSYLLGMCLLAADTSYQCNPYVKTDVPNIFICTYHKYNILSVEHQIR